MKGREQVVEGRCGCGKRLIVVRVRGQRAFTTKHELPTCAEYDAAIAEGIAAGQTRHGGFEVIPPRKSK